MDKGDKRRRQWFPLAVDFTSDDMGTKLLDKYGHAGLLTWAAYLAACKRGINEGEFTYTSEADGWSKLGLDYPVTPSFTLEEFFTYTGRLKKTRRRRDGRVVNVSCTVWKAWIQGANRQTEREEKSRKRAQNTGDTTRTLSGHYGGLTYTDTETVTPTPIPVDGSDGYGWETIASEALAQLDRQRGNT